MKRTILASLLTMALCLTAHANLQASRALPAAAFTATNEDQELIYLNTELGSFEKRLQMIESAQHSIAVEFYIFLPDEAGRIFTQALMQKIDMERARGNKDFKIQVIVDKSPVSKNLNEFYTQIMKNHGIEVRYYNTTALLNLGPANHRSHRKLLLIDETEAITGGRNMSSDYFALSAVYNFIDRDIYIRGSIVKSMRASFDLFFNASLTKAPAAIHEPTIQDYGFKNLQQAKSEQTVSNVSRDRYNKYRQALASFKKEKSLALDFAVESDSDRAFLKRIRTLGPKALATEPHGICKETYFFADMPGRGAENRVVYAQLKNFLNNTQKSLLVETPFLVFDKDDPTFPDLIKRGVSVDLVTNSLASIDVTTAVTVLYARADKVIASGARILLYDATAPTGEYPNAKAAQATWGIHAKSVVFDDDTSMIGTFNLDPRSENVNAEIMIACRGNVELAQGLKASIQRTMAQTVILNTADDQTKYMNTTRMQRAMGYLLHPFGELFDFWL